MIGNVWEWTDDWYCSSHPAGKNKQCCIPANPRGGPKSDSHDHCGPTAIPRKTLKGGSICVRQIIVGATGRRPVTRSP